MFLHTLGQKLTFKPIKRHPTKLELSFLRLTSKR